MLKDKSLFEFDLVEDINVQESEKICGGAEYMFINRLDSDMPFTILLGTEQIKERLAPFNQPGSQITREFEPKELTILFDRIQGQGFSLATGTAFPGANTFEVIEEGDNKIELVSGSIVDPAFV